MELHVQLRHYIFIPNGRYSKNNFPPPPTPPPPPPRPKFSFFSN